MLKKKCEKILMLILLSMLMFNFIGTNVVIAAPDGETIASQATANLLEMAQDDDWLNAELKVAQQMDWSNIAGGALDAIVGTLTYFERFKVIIIGGVCQFLGTVVAESAGTTESITFISPEDILFNKLAITDINFFNINTFGATDKALSGSNNPIKMLKENVARWYMTLRTIALIILVAVLIYIGIRMAMTSVASEKAEYKKMLMNWIVSLAIVFLLHYIILFVIQINNSLVNILGDLQDATLKDDFYGNYLTELVLRSFDPRFTVGWTSAILYMAVVALTFVFLIMYIKRMITIAFLILISPIITITYSIDKVGNGKAEAFESWIREFFENVLIQPFHCLIYLAFTSVAMNLLEKTASLAATLLVILTMFFILESEKLVKKIFGIKSESTGSALTTAAMISTAFGKLNIKKDDKKVPTNNGGGNTPPAGSTARTRTASNVATNNMNAVNPPNSGAAQPPQPPAPSGNSPRNPRNMSSEELSAKISGGQAHVDDYESLMGNKPTLTPEQRLAQAEADDYNSLMGFDDNNNTASNTPQRNRVYGIPGTLQPQQAQATATDLPRNREYGWLGTQPGPAKEPSIADNWKNAAKGFGNFIVDANKKSSGLAGAVIGGTLAGVAGKDIVETAAAAGVGYKIQNNVIEEKIEQGRGALKDYFAEKDIKNSEQILANNFNKYKNGADYKPEDVDMAQNYLKMTKEQVSNIPDASQKQYVQSLHATRNVLSKKYQGEELDNKVVETMHKVVNKEIPPELDA